jgi:hypothetical protein
MFVTGSRSFPAFMTDVDGVDGLFLELDLCVQQLVTALCVRTFFKCVFGPRLAFGCSPQIVNGVYLFT